MGWGGGPVTRGSAPYLSPVAGGSPVADGGPSHGRGATGEVGGTDPAGLRDVAVALAQGAAQVITAATGDARPAAATTVTSKSTPTDLVTDVDRAVEGWLLDRLAQWRPGDAVLGEERGSSSGTTGVRWLLDPIDGTVNFVLGLPEFAVSVAAEVDGVVTAGAVCAPRTGELFSAHLGGGAFLTGCGWPGRARCRWRGR